MGILDKKKISTVQEAHSKIAQIGNILFSKITELYASKNAKDIDNYLAYLARQRNELDTAAETLKRLGQQAAGELEIRNALWMQSQLASNMKKLMELREWARKELTTKTQDIHEIERKEREMEALKQELDKFRKIEGYRPVETSRIERCIKDMKSKFYGKPFGVEFPFTERLGAADVILLSEQLNRNAFVAAENLGESKLKNEVIDILKEEREETRYFKEAIVPAITQINHSIDVLNKTLAEESLKMNIMVQDYVGLDHKSEQELMIIVEEIAELQSTQDELINMLRALSEAIEGEKRRQKPLPRVEKALKKKKAEFTRIESLIGAMQSDLNKVWTTIKSWHDEYGKFSELRKEQMERIDGRRRIISQLADKGPLANIHAAMETAATTITKSQTGLKQNMQNALACLSLLDSIIHSIDQDLITAINKLQQTIHEEEQKVKALKYIE